MSEQVMNATAGELQIQVLASRVLAQIPALLDAENKCLNASQQLKLESHVRAMARRELSGEGLPDFDRALFDEISPAAMRLSRAVVALFAKLPDEEALLLSIHFEMAKNKA